MMLTLILLQLLLGGDYIPQMLALTGAADVEELSEETLERFAALSSRPLPINAAGRSRLLGCGLFSAYQVASLLDYRERTGDIRSLTELALVDGFGEDFTRALAPFIRIDGQGPGGAPPPRKWYQSLTLRGGVRMDTGQQPRWSGKGNWHGEWKETLELSVSTAGSWSAAWHGRKIDLILGDYNARFGQGLALWSGFSLSGFSSSASFARNPTGVRASSAHSRANRFRGAAARFETRHWATTAFWADGGLWGLNEAFTGRMLSASLSAAHQGEWNLLSLDAKYCLRGFTLSGEAAWETGTKMPALLGSLQWSPVYGSSLSLLGRYYPACYSGRYAAAPRSSTKSSDEAGVSAGVRYDWAELTADAAWHPTRQTRHFKTLVKLAPQWTLPSGWTLGCTARWTWRIRPEEKYPHRQDLRVDLSAGSGPWNLTLRGNFVYSREAAWLSYAEAGYRTEGRALWLRATLFRVDRWEDRIYVYERDAPGEFSVPACYGRGYGLSLYALWRPWYLRIGMTRYPGSEKADRMEIKLALVWR